MESNGGDVNYWPGFVDALSNVVLTLVFVLVIFVFALVMASNKVEQKMQEVIAAKKEHEENVKSSVPTESEIDELRRELHETKEKLRAYESKENSESKVEDVGSLDQISQSDALEDKKIVVPQKNIENALGSVTIKDDEKKKVTIVFPSGVNDLDENSTEELVQALNLPDYNLTNRKIILRSIVGNESFSAAERLAYYRVLIIRNFIIEKKGVQPSQISSVILRPDKPEEGRVEIIFKD